MEINIFFLGKQHQLNIDRPHYIRRLGYPKNYEVPERIQESMDWALAWYRKNGSPWLQIYELDVSLKEEDLFLNKIQTKAPKVYKRFQKYNVKKALLMASTAGGSVDKKTTELWSKEPDKAFFLDTFAASVTETIVSFAINYIQNWTQKKGMKMLSRYSPGYPGWDLKEQLLLMEIIKKESKTDIPITISDTALLSPLKSQLSLVGIYTGEDDEKQIDIECTKCSFIDCSCKDKGIFIKI